MPRSFWLLIASLFLGLVAIPIAVYLAGQHYIAPYEGSRGLASFFGVIYGDAFQGKTLAVLLLLAPALIVVTWMLHLRIWKATAGEVTEPPARYLTKS
jgi:hypothetical protein